MLSILLGLFGIVMTLAVVIGFHELGHFLMARLVGVKVLRFSIGFGKVLFSRRDKHGTQYAVSLIPLGGYVQMLDEESITNNVDKKCAYHTQPLYKKALIILAGPMINFILAVFIYWFLFSIGFKSVSPIIGNIIPHSIAAEAKVKPLQEIITINGQSTQGWLSVIMEILMADKKNSLQVETSENNNNYHYTLDLAKLKLDPLKPDPLSSLGIEPWVPDLPATVGDAIPNMPAYRAGIRPLDRIIKVNGKSIKDWDSFSEIIQKNPDTPVILTIKRNKAYLTFHVITAYERNWKFEKIGVIGLKPQLTIPPHYLKNNQYPVFQALQKGYLNTYRFLKLNAILMTKLMTGELSLQSLGGPVSIFSSAGVSINHGLIPFLSFLAFISISIGFINLLPIPGLDGGHLFIELLQRASFNRLSPKYVQILYIIGFSLLLFLLLQSLINDFYRL